LVVSFAGTAVGDGFAAFFFGDLDLTTGNYGAGEGGSEEIDALLLLAIAFSFRRRLLRRRHCIGWLDKSILRQIPYEGPDCQ
jgi:hypothetical protein